MVDFSLERFITKYLKARLRQMWIWYPIRQRVKNAAETAPGSYQCSQCGEDGFTRAEVEVDHIDPVGSFNAFQIDEYVKRLFCGPENLRVLCKGCHRDKTKAEGIRRRRSKQE